MSHKTDTSARSRFLVLTLVMVALVRFSLTQSPQEPLQASIFDSIHTLIFGSSSSSAKSIKTVTTHKAASNSSTAPVAESSSATSFAPSFTVPTQKWVTVQGYRFMRTLRNGMLGDDVMNLQFILNRNPITQMAKTGVESPGQETGIYDYKTRIGMIAFQKLYLKTAAQLVRLHREQGTAGLTTRTILEKVAKEMLASGALPSSTDTLHAAARSAASAQLALRSSTSSKSAVFVASSQNSSAATTETNTSASSATAQSQTSTASTGSQSSTSRASSVASVANSAVSIASSRASSATSIVTSRVLVPGSGFTGITPQPDPEGSGTASDEKAIARWDVVPYQTFDTSMNVGVVAFHINDIEKVSFSVNGGPWKDIPSMTLNPETSVVEYWVTLRASDFADGQVEVRAIAYPNAGVPRVLAGLIPPVSNSNTATTNGEHSMWLFANAHGALNTEEIYVRPSSGNDANIGTISAPVATLRKALTLAKNKEGAHIILLEAGQYNPDRETDPNTVSFLNNRWITVESGPGLTREQVEIVGTDEGDRLISKIAKLALKNITLRPDTFGYMNESTQGAPNFLWFEHCLITTAILSPGDVPQWRGNVYVTNSRVDKNAYGFTSAELVRNSVVRNAFDAFQSSKLVINSSVESMRQSAFGAQHHPDFYQTWGDVKNVILYGMSGDDIDGTQILFINQPLSVGPTMTDAAFVDWNVKTYDPNGGPSFSQLQGPMRNVLVRDVNISMQKLIPRIGPPSGLNSFTARNVTFQNATFYNTLTPIQMPVGMTYNGIAGTWTYSASSTASSVAASSLPASSTASITPPASSSVASIGGTAPTGLVGHWAFDGDAADSIAGANGTLMNGPAFVSGHINQGLSFDGADDYVSIADVPSIQNIWDNGGTISFWLYPRTCGKSNAGYWVSKSSYTLYSNSPSSTACGLEFDMTWSGGAAKWRGGGSKIPITLNTWNHIVLTYNDDAASNVPTLYVNDTAYSGAGTVFGQVIAPSGTRTTDSAKAMQIGGNTALSRTADGIMDDLRFYDYALSASEVGQLYSGTLAMHEKAGFFDFLKNLLASLLH